MDKQEYFLQTQFGEAFTETGFYNWFTEKARKAGVPKGRSPQGYESLLSAFSGGRMLAARNHVDKRPRNLKEVERYTKAANRANLADSAIAALQSAQKEGVNLGKRDSKLANMLGTVSQSSDRSSCFYTEKDRRWRSGRDSNPRYGFTTVQRFSKPPPSASRPPLQMKKLHPGQDQFSVTLS